MDKIVNYIKYEKNIIKILKECYDIVFLTDVTWSLKGDI